MDKLIGYTEITVKGEVIPIKLGTWALQRFSEEYPVKLVELNSVFEVHEFNGKELKVPVDLIKFLTTAMWAGANYVRKVNGQPLYDIMDAYEWADEIGLNTAPALKIMSEFWMSIENGGPVRLPSDQPAATGKPKKKS